jgi:hypothetical protein
MGANDGNWLVTEILNQIDSTRTYGGNGSVFFRTASIKNNQKGLTDQLKNTRYKYPANIPPMPWKDNIKPNPPVDFTITTTDSLSYFFSWSKPLPASDGDTAKYFNVYMDDNYPVNISDVRNMIKFRMVNDTSFTMSFDSIPSSSVFFAVTSYDKGYNESDPAEAEILILSSSENIEAFNYELEQNYPNPFNPSTVISFKIGKPGSVKISVYDLLGNELNILIDDYLSAGKHSIEFDASGLASGIYFYKIVSGEFVQSKKMILIK